MEVTGVDVKVLPFDSSSATTSVRYDYDEMYRTGQKKDSFLTTVMRGLEELDKGATVIIKPLLNFDSLKEGKKIQAIKLLRQETGLALKEGKAMIDSGWIWNKVKEVI